MRSFGHCEPDPCSLPAGKRLCRVSLSTANIQDFPKSVAYCSLEFFVKVYGQWLIIIIIIIIMTAVGLTPGGSGYIHVHKFELGN